MKFKIHHIFVLLSIFFFSCEEQKKHVEKPNLSLEIIPMDYPFEKSPISSISIYYPEIQKFHVLLTNKSEKAIKIWDEWNSWGYFGLSFEITYPDGRKNISSKVRPYGWAKNYPSWIKIPTNKYYIFEVNFENDMTSSNYWHNSVLNEQGDLTVCKLKAIYEIKEDKESILENVWTGRVESKEESFNIYH